MLTFVILAAVMVVGAVGVITLRQPVHAALSLVGTLLTLAVTYVTLEAHFLAAVQVIVYAGAIMVLFLFVIMLLNIEGDAVSAALPWMRPLAYVVALVAAAAVAVVAFGDAQALPDPALVREVLNGGGAGEIAESLFTEFMLPFQLVGVLLLTGIVGAVGLVQRRAAEAPQPEPAPVAVRAPAGSGGAVAVLGLPLAGRDDDLQRIRGIGPKLEGLLKRHGITTFAQIASMNQEQVEELSTLLPEFRGRIERDAWLEQARRLEEEDRDGD